MSEPSSPQLRLTPHTRSILALRVQWLNTPRVARYLYGEEGERRTTVREQESWFDRYEHDSSRQLFTILLDDQPIGIVGLTDIDQTAGIAEAFIMIGEDAAVGRGYGARALRMLDAVARSLGIHRIIATTHRDNAAAIACNRAAGYEEDRAQESAMMLQMSKNIRHSAMRAR